MLGGKMSNQDEDEVEDELEAMEREVVGVPSLPDAPTVVKQDLPDVPQETPEEKAKRRRRERAANQEPLAA
jgi:charged multivesicular body protein 6